ncbi:hypothetical protein [Fervidicoccus fontis]|nr:hypothetical protein [Fervidicoccus fontis]
MKPRIRTASLDIYGGVNFYFDEFLAFLSFPKMKDAVMKKCE